MRYSQDTVVPRAIDHAALRHGRRVHQTGDLMHPADAESLFHGLLDDALDEITRREFELF